MLFQQKVSANQGSTARGWIGRLSVPAFLLGALAIAGSGAALAADGVITYETNGIGVDGKASGEQVPTQINHDALSGETEAIAVDFGAAVKTATVTVSNLFANEGERGQWEAFDVFGQPVGMDEFYLPANENVGDVGPISVEEDDVTASFRYLVFTALRYETPAGNDSSDYFVRSITYTLDLDDAEPIPVSGEEEGDWASLSPTAFNLGSPYRNADGSFADAEVVDIDIDTFTCSGDGSNNTDGCIIQFADDFSVTVKDSSDVDGSATAIAQTIVDPRGYCGGDDNNPHPARLDLGFDLDGSDGDMTGPIIPAELCGIPNLAGDPEFKLVNINSGVTVIRSVLELTAEDPANGEYSCNQTDNYLRPVIGWLPKTSNPGYPEVPVNNGDGLVTELQDVTYACGSARGGSSRFSFLVYNLHYVENAQYEGDDGIIKKAIDQLNYTVADSDNCVDKVENKAVLSRAKSATSAFDTGRYSTAKRQYINMLETVSNDVNYEQCYFNLVTDEVNKIDPGSVTENDLPRNFRGDLIVQIRHILYMIDKFLGEKKPALPPELL